MRFYASKCHDRLNGMDFRLEDDTEYLMLNPKYPVTLSRPVRYMLDSGAFQDVRAESRLTYQGALDRQMGFERRVGQRADRIVSYDRLVDEQKTPTGGQFKARVDEDTGAEYVEDTIKAAEFLASRRESLDGRTLVLSCQGTTVGQYLGCVSSVMDVAEPGDTIGIGGFCIMSRRKEYQEQYRDIMGAAVPAIAGGGVRSIHVFGMGMVPWLAWTDALCRRHGVMASYDTSSYEVNATMGRLFDPADGRLAQIWGKEDKYTGYHPCACARMNTRMMTRFWEEFDGLEARPGVRREDPLPFLRPYQGRGGMDGAGRGCHGMHDRHGVRRVRTRVRNHLHRAVRDQEGPTGPPTEQTFFPFFGT